VAVTTNNVDVEEEIPEPLYQNDYYFVAVIVVNEGEEPYVDGKFVYKELYGVINRQTGVLEHACVQLPEAIFCASALETALNKSPWNWAKSIESELVN
jgi:hypothetical protein